MSELDTFERSKQKGNSSAWWRIGLLIIIVFFFSGAVGLIYEVVWNRMLTIVFGSTVFATTTILTAFMSGMGLGSFIFGRLADKSRNPLKIYGYMELFIGVFAVLVPYILAIMDSVYIFLYRMLHAQQFIFVIIRFILCLTVLIVPTTLMGGTLPVMSRAFTRQSSRIGWSIGLLYSVNTFGAVIGCFLSGFVLVRLFGVSWTVLISALINIAIAIFVLYLSPKDIPQTIQENKKIQPEPSMPQWVGIIALCVSGISGLCALAYEVLWTRILVLFLGSTTYAFSTMLSTFLLGIALGSIIFAKFIDSRRNALLLLSFIQAFIALSVMALLPLTSKLYDIGTSFKVANWFMFIFSKYAVSSLIILLPTILMGGAFPLVARIYAQSINSLGRYVGDIYFVNTMGGIVGSILSGFVFIPAIGVQKSILFFSFLNIGLAVLLMVANFKNQGLVNRRLIVPSTVLVLVILASIITSASVDVDKPITLHTPIFKGSGKDNKLLFYKEDVDSSVTVVEDKEGIRRIFVDTNQAAEDSRWDLPSHSIIGHLPILLHPNPKNALVIGFGMGVTSWSITRHGVQVDAVEISRGVVESNHFFTKVNHNVLNEPLVNLVIDDGRNFALTVPKRYDMISTGIIHPLVSSNSAGFYTKDFYELCKKRLTENGIMCQWVPLHRLPEEDFKTIIRTFKESFPHTTLWYKFTPDFIILIGTPNELSIDYKDFASRIANPKVKQDLELVNMSDPIALLDSFMMDERTIDQYTGDGPLHTDDHPRIEFFGPHAVNTTYQNLSGMLKYRVSVLPYITNIEPHQFNLVRDKLQVYFEATQYAILGQLYYARGDYNTAYNRFLAASAINPEDTNVKWQISYVEKQMGLSEQALLDKIRSGDKDADAHIKLGMVYQNRGEYDKAIEEFKKAIEIDPNSILAHSNLAFIYEAQGKFFEAVQELKEVARIQPNLPQVYVSLGLLYDKQGLHEDAIASMKKALELQPNSPMAMINLGIIYRNQGKIDEAIKQFKDVLKVQPNSGVIHGVLGDLYRQKGDLAKAEEELNTALKLDPSMMNEPNFIATMALIYFQKGKYKEAESEIKKAISLDPNNQYLRELLEEIQKKTKK